MKAAVSDLLAARSTSWDQLIHHYGGDESGANRVAVGFLHLSAEKGVISPLAARDRIETTLAYRAQHTLDRPDVLRDIETARCRSHWPYAFAETAPDGSPVEICRLSRLSVPRILSDFPEDEVVHFFALWCEHTLRLYGESVRAGAETKGSYHVYDCREVRWKTLLSDARNHWATVSRVFAVGQDHWPDLASRYFIIHAPFAASFLWKLITPLVGEHVKHKVSFDSGVPAELKRVLGGDAAVERMLECSPHVARQTALSSPHVAE